MENNNKKIHEDLRNELDNLVNKLANEKQIKDILFKEDTLNSISDNEEVTFVFFDCLNRKRASLIEIEEEPFNLIVTLFNDILSVVEQKQSFDLTTFQLIEYLIILSQTIYKKPKTPQSILSECLWQSHYELWNSDIWKSLVMFQIFRESNRIKQSNIKYKEDSLQFKQIILSILITCKVNMESFHCEKSIMNTIDDIGQIYNVNLNN